MCPWLCEKLKFQSISVLSYSDGLWPNGKGTEWRTIRKQNKGRRKSEGGKDIQIHAWEGVIICRHKNAWMASILAGPKQMCRSPRRQTRWLCGRNTCPLVHGMRQKPNTTSSMWGGSTDGPLKKAAFSERGWRGGEKWRQGVSCQGQHGIVGSWRGTHWP